MSWSVIRLCSLIQIVYMEVNPICTLTRLSAATDVQHKNRRKKNGQVKEAEQSRQLDDGREARWPCRQLNLNEITRSEAVASAAEHIRLVATVVGVQ